MYSIKQAVKHAYQMKAETHETEVMFNIYSKGCYILDTEEDRVIDVVLTEEEAIDICNCEELKGEVYYKPILIDADSGKRVTRDNFEYYDLKSDWVKNHIKELREYDNFVHGN